MLETLLAAGGGSITGAVAGVGTAYIQAKSMEAMLPLRLKELEMQVDVAKQQRRGENDAQMEETRRTEINAAADTHIAALEMDKATYGMWLIDALRGMVRPVITGWCVYILTELTLIMWDLNAGSFTADFSQDLFKHLVVTWTYLATTVVVYWFGSRGGRAPQFGGR